MLEYDFNSNQDLIAYRLSKKQEIYLNNEVLYILYVCYSNVFVLKWLYQNYYLSDAVMAHFLCPLLAIKREKNKLNMYNISGNKKLFLIGLRRSYFVKVTRY